MPTKPSRARKWVRDRKAIGKFNKLGQYYVQLIIEPSGTEIQPIFRDYLPVENSEGRGHFLILIGNP